MTKLLLDNVSPLAVLINCSNEPGCKYYKNAFDQAVKNLAKNIKCGWIPG